MRVRQAFFCFSFLLCVIGSSPTLSCASSVGVVERLRLEDTNQLVKEYNERQIVEGDDELSVLPAEQWLHGFEYWSPYHDEIVNSEGLDFSID